MKGSVLKRFLRGLILVLCALLFLSWLVLLAANWNPVAELVPVLALPSASPAPVTEETPPSETPAPPPTPEPPAELLDVSFDLDPYVAGILRDASYTTDYRFPAGTRITVTAERPIGSLYILFGSYPHEWDLLDANNLYTYGRHAFLHEYVRLEVPSTSVELRMPYQPIRICSIQAYSEGYPPPELQVWEAPDEPADILVFSTHADDELLFLGGLIPYYTAVRGLRVQVIYMTTNYDENNFSDYSLSYRFRPHEALNGLWAAGDRIYPVTNMVPDVDCQTLGEAQAVYGADQFAAFQAEMIRRYKPLVVVTLSESGEYGHGAHVLTALSAERAVEAAADPAQFPDSAEKYGVWDTPKTYLHNYGPVDGMTVLNYEEASEALGGLTPFEAAQNAYALHLTQQQWSLFYVYGTGTRYDSHRFGLYRTLVGPDAEKNDLMENVSRDLFPAS